MRHTATLNLEEIDVTFSGVPAESDYGVQGSPVWTEMQDVQIEEVYILGVNVPVKQLPDELKSQLFELSSEVEW